MNRILVTSLLALAASAPTILLISCANRGFTFGGEKPQVFSGTIETREIRVGSKAGGRVTGVLVEEGQAVEPDQPLVRFDVAELEAQRSQAEARIAQQRARLERLQHGARPEEIAQARAATETARASYEAVRTWPRPEEVEQARASLAAAEADLGNAQSAFERAQRLRATGDISQQEFDSAKFRLENMRARRDAEKKRLDLLQNGSRPQDVRAAQERYRQAQEAERLVRAGPRTEEIADAKAQLAEAQARLEQIKVQLAEGEVKAPSKAIVEAVSVRPGDLVTPNQTIAKLLERDQIWVRIYIPEPQLGNIRVGQHAKVKVDTFRDQSFDGVIEQINEQGEFTPRNVQSRDERNHQVFGVKVKIDNREGKLKSGMAADVTLENR
ncbi:MAG TPA: efflux RND transporter periplasmic adaptor subunit [Blastocatellia bacterium]|nr:efflux RND transporter periplasmic adaptor subunit [Blastocatellia bacterium]